MDMKRFFLYAIVIAALVLAGCGGNGGGTQIPPGPTVEQQLSNAKTAAAAAETAAKTAKDAAEKTFAALMDKMSVDVANYTRASDANGVAMTAYEAAKAANMKAQAATTVADAQKYRDMAQTEQKRAEDANMDVTKYATLVQNAQQAIGDEAQRVIDVAAARGVAMQSYMDADADATKAEAAADAAEETAPGSPGAVAAREAATAARTAADAVKTAHDAITDGMSKADADMKAEEAKTAASNANSSYMMAKAENDAIQTVADTLQEQQRVRDVATAKTAAATAVQAAMTAKTNAEDAATAAETARDAAKAEYKKAMAARTDIGKAKAEYEKAIAAATEARTAATAAAAAYVAAKIVADGVMDAGTAEAAKMAQKTAETEQGKAETAAGTAETQKMAAETAQGKAEMYAGTHVLGLLKAATAVGVMDDASTTDMDEQAEAIKAVVTVISAAAGTPDSGSDNNSSPIPGATGQAKVMWPADTPDNPATTDTDESMMGMLSISTSASFAPAAFRMEAAKDDPATTAVDESKTMPKTATKIDGLPGFMHGYSISDGTKHAIVFTDKRQGTPAVVAVTAVSAANLVNASVSGSTVTDLGTRSATGYTGVTYYNGISTVGKNTDMGLAFMGTLTCPSATECSAELAADGTIIVEGYVFTGSREARAAVAQVAAVENTDYLAFGVWLNEDSDGNANNGNQPLFAAFSDGGRVFPTPASLTGSATYKGAATGVYTAGTSVDYFQANATLTANFGMPGTTDDPAAADDELGTITGIIDGIVAGGVNMADVINLNSGSITALGNFSGNARMGDAMVMDDAATYPYDGYWGGKFYGSPAAADAKGVETLPPAVAGTFGVTGTMGTGEDAVSRSYVGAFGARR